MLHFVFSTALIYSSLTSSPRFNNGGLVWILKAMLSFKAALLVLVHSFYLRLIWVLAKGSFMNPKMSHIIKFFSIITFSYILLVVAAFLAYLEQIDNFSNFSVSFERMFTFACASTCGIDFCIVTMVSFILWSSRSSKVRRRQKVDVVNYLITFFVGTGLLTSITAVLGPVLYASSPSSTIYLAIDFVLPNLYANSILALFNSKSRLKGKMDASVDLHMPSALIFGEDSSSLPDNSMEGMREQPTA